MVNHYDHNDNSERAQQIVNFKTPYLAQKCLKLLPRLYFTHYNNM